MENKGKTILTIIVFLIGIFIALGVINYSYTKHSKITQTDTIEIGY